MTRELRVLSLFSGCGGMDLGMEGGFEVLSRSINPNSQWDIKLLPNGKFLLPRTRFKNVFANDIRKDAKRAYVEYFSKRSTPVHYALESVVNLVKQQYEGENIFPLHVDIVTGGFPCQDFSVAGKRLGFNSHRSHDGNLRNTEIPIEESRGNLYNWMRKVIAIVEPKMFIAENVKGLTNLKDAKEIIENDFSTIGEGYLVLSQVLNAADYGVPQNRERVIFLGFNKKYLTKDAFSSLLELPKNSLFNPYPPRHIVIPFLIAS